MAIRSFQQIMDALEAAQEMLRSLEVDVRDTLADAKAELERFRAPVVTALDTKTYDDYKAGDTFVMVHNDDGSVTVGATYTLELDGLQGGLCFLDNDGDPRHFYSWWLMAD